MDRAGANDSVAARAQATRALADPRGGRSTDRRTARASGGHGAVQPGDRVAGGQCDRAGVEPGRSRTACGLDPLRTKPRPRRPSGCRSMATPCWFYGAGRIDTANGSSSIRAGIRTGMLEWSPVTKAGGRAWRKALQRAGIDQFRWHDLRHTWASWHVQSGTPLHVLQELGGWSDFAMVRKYAHLAPEHLAEHAARIETGLRSVPHSFRHTASADTKKAATLIRNRL